MARANFAFTNTTEEIMKRWHEDYKITLREWKKHRQTHIDSNKSQSAYLIGKKADEIDCVCDLQVGRFRKMDAFDCGNPRCYMCRLSLALFIKGATE